MLALLGASLLLTAIIVRSTYTPANNLAQTAKILEDNLQKKESYVGRAIGTPEGLYRFRSLDNNDEEALKCIEEFTVDHNIKVLTYKKDTLKFWSDISYIPDNPKAIKLGYSFIRGNNGYYEAIKQVKDNFCVIFLIPVKINYSVKNQYLQNTFAKDLLEDNNIEIADFTDKNTYAVHSVADTYLFSVKVKYNEVNFRFFYFELVLWILTLIVTCTLVQNISNYLANKGQIVLSLLLLAFFIVGVRFVNLYYNWPNFTYKLAVFKPEIYKASDVFPSLGDLCINILAVSWFVACLYRQRFKLLKYAPGRVASYTIVISCIVMLIATSTALLNVFYGLVVKSQINFDVNNVLNLSGYSLCGILMLCFSFLIFYLLDEVFLTFCSKLAVSARHQFLLLGAGVLLATVYYTFYRGELILFYILWFFIVLIRGYAYFYTNARITTLKFAAILFICSVISSVNLNHFEDIKERKIRKLLITKLEKPDDKTADSLFRELEDQIAKDPLAIRYFNDTVHNDDYLKNHFQKLYFDGYLSKYNLTIHEFNSFGKSISNDKNDLLDNFKAMVLFSSIKVSKYFYRENESFGFQNYFAILPVVDGNQLRGSIVIELKSKTLQIASHFPELLMDGEIKNDDELKNYSYAFYSDDKLVAQSGSFVYKIVRDKDTTKKFLPKTYKFKIIPVTNAPWYHPFQTYSHLIYKQSSRNIIVISKEENTVFYSVTSVTFFFVILLAFSLLTLAGSWAWLRIKILTITNNKIKWGFKITLDKILYKTRIQFSMVFAVVITLILVGIITYISISTQYQTQQERGIREKLIKITDAFESSLFDKYMVHINEQSLVTFDALAASSSSDLVLFDREGNLLITTQPRIYGYGLIARRMNPKAFVTLHSQLRSEYVNDETIGSLNYKTVYAPIRIKGQTVAFLQLPYFSNETDYREQIGSLLNIMINIYALIFIAIGLFAVVIARQITYPLNFIQESLSNTIYGKKNEPITWDRDDEIGSLVKEYNKMIAALEDSATRLAQSERESAWREMAKQVAHEIKNPLTPLKLGLQLLEKSWREKDPRFDQKFERFSKSFVEQIESLSSIASEFSAFAKMPDTRMERFNIFDVIDQAVIIFKQTDNFNIIYKTPGRAFFVNADRDQLLRCFNNLLKNAIEATPPDRFGLLEIKNEETYNNILLTVKDNGNGIPENMREKIFEPNFTTKSSGTGLGLAFVKNSIENAGGKVWFETEIGRGTTFFLSLPAANS
ncbi:HAMP domain-containing protein [Mucilaginibacter corticis]|uniref:histidine kinase n=2 Tax=Mucilaginibacter corticis TaxID=2597670 RepID=A0A556MUA9_9SPHI|nr:HAMP domain-containing protein [Mucilaginibacter corticis]